MTARSRRFRAAGTFLFQARVSFLFQAPAGLPFHAPAGFLNGAAGTFLAAAAMLSISPALAAGPGGMAPPPASTLPAQTAATTVSTPSAGTKISTTTLPTGTSRTAPAPGTLGKTPRLSGTADIPVATGPGQGPRRARPYPDVPPGHWAAPAVDALVKKHILAAAPGQPYQGERPVTRYELAVALYRMVQYLEQGKVSSSAGVKDPAKWLVDHSYLAPETFVRKPPATAPVTPALLSESLAYVADRILLNRAPKDKPGSGAGGS